MEAVGGRFRGQWRWPSICNLHLSHLADLALPSDRGGDSDRWGVAARCLPQRICVRDRSSASVQTPEVPLVLGLMGEQEVQNSSE